MLPLFVNQCLETLYIKPTLSTSMYLLFVTRHRILTCATDSPTNKSPRAVTLYYPLTTLTVCDPCSSPAQSQTAHQKTLHFLTHANCRDKKISGAFYKEEYLNLSDYKSVHNPKYACHSHTPLLQRQPSPPPPLSLTPGRNRFQYGQRFYWDPPTQ